MPRGKKQTGEQLNEGQLYDVLEFARQVYNGNIAGVYTPELTNARMKDLNLNPLSATESGVSTALQDPKNNELKLIGYSEFFYLTSMLYKRMMGYMAQMLSFDYTTTCINATKEDYGSRQYKKDLEIMHEFLDKFNAKKEFKQIMNQVMMNETYYGVFRDEMETKHVFQELPYMYCKLTGRCEYSLLFDFNMQYFFSNPGVDLNCFPPVFKEYYNRIMDSKINGYRPSSQLDKRTGEWVYWVQTSPEDGMFSFKFSAENATSVPYFAPLFSDVVLAPLTRNLQKNINILKAQKLIIGLIPMLKETKSGSVKDAIAIDPTTLGNFLGLLKAGLNESIKISGMPFTDLKEIGFDSTNSNVLEEYSKTTSAMSGINSRLIFANDKMSASETQASIDVDEYMTSQIYGQFDQFMEYQINKRTKKFKFRFRFQGTEFKSNRQFRFDTAMKLADKGLVLYQQIAASVGIEPKDFIRQLEECNACGLTDSLTSLISITQQSKDSKTNGRTKEEGTLNDNTENSRDYGSNIEKGGEI